jgi:hypothetical protein
MPTLKSRLRLRITANRHSVLQICRGALPSESDLIAEVALDGAAGRLAATVVALAWRVEAVELASAFGVLACRFPPSWRQRRKRARFPRGGDGFLGNQVQHVRGLQNPGPEL